eukprot:EG_transcript_6144
MHNPYTCDGPSFIVTQPPTTSVADRARGAARGEACPPSDRDLPGQSPCPGLRAAFAAQTGGAMALTSTTPVAEVGRHTPALSPSSSDAEDLASQASGDGSSSDGSSLSMSAVDGTTSSWLSGPPSPGGSTDALGGCPHPRPWRRLRAKHHFVFFACRLCRHEWRVPSKHNPLYGKTQSPAACKEAAGPPATAN